MIFIMKLEGSPMGRTKLKLKKSRFLNLVKETALVVLFTGCVASLSTAQQKGQRTFTSPEEAAKAFVAAAQSNDEKAMLDILGPDGKQIVSSGDATEDAESRAKFVQKYQQMHRLAIEPDGTPTLYIDAENWPTPITLMKKGNSGYCDTEAGEEEIV